MGLRKDIWRIGIVERPMREIVGAATLAAAPVRWIEADGAFRFLADPFGLWRRGRLHVFAETYDYRDRHGRIDCLVFDADYRLLSRTTVLAEPWHLSYPFVFEADGETWMLPEAFRSGRLTLYRAADFPHRWERAGSIMLDRVAIDATPVFRDGLWWLFFSADGSRLDKTGVMHLAYAERLSGPWRPHPMSPVRRDVTGSRPGGTPVVIDDRLHIPVQDCSRTYGGAVAMLRVDVLTPDRFVAEPIARLTAPPSSAPFLAGLHTVSDAGPVTLVDCKRIDVSAHGLAIDLMRRCRLQRPQAA